MKQTIRNLKGNIDPTQALKLAKTLGLDVRGLKKHQISEVKELFRDKAYHNECKLQLVEKVNNQISKMYGVPR